MYCTNCDEWDEWDERGFSFLMGWGGDSGCWTFATRGEEDGREGGILGPLTV